MAPKSRIPETMPTALVVAACDGDVGTKQPLRYRNRQLDPLRPALTSTFTLAGGTHNAFSTSLDPISDPECHERELLEADVQQAWTAAFVPGFFDAALGYGQLPSEDEAGS